MPVYEYECTKCGKIDEKQLSIKENVPAIACSKCGSISKKIISKTTFVLKGTGWYATDYKPRGLGEKAT